MLSSTGNYALRFLPDALSNAHTGRLQGIGSDKDDLTKEFENFMSGFSNMDTPPVKTEKRFLRFLDEKLDLGEIIGLFEINNDGSVEQKSLEPDPSNPTKKRKQTVKNTPCN